MKIIARDNYNRDDRSETLVDENVAEYYAKLVAKLLNAYEPEDTPNYYVAMPDDFKLFIWEP